MQVIVRPYDPQWPVQFEAIKDDLSATLKQNDVPYVSIEHVGSTSIPDMPAKPVLDIDVIIEAANLDKAIKALTGESTKIFTTPEDDLRPLRAVAKTATIKNGPIQEAKYVYKGDLGIPDRHVLSYIPHLNMNRYYKPDPSLDSSEQVSPHSPEPMRNLYICIANSSSLKNHLAVRNLCRMHPEIRQRYATTKVELSKYEWKSVDEYAEAKSDVISWILERAIDLDVGNAITCNEIQGIRNVNTLATR